MVAFVSVFARTVIRLRYQKQLFIDDLFLYFGVVCLCAAMGLLVEFSDDLYLDEALKTNHLPMILPSNYLTRMFRFQKTQDAYFVLLYTTISCVKLSFLFFFRILVQRVRKMIIYWWTVLFIMIVAYIPCIVVGIFLPCPHFDTASSMI